MLIPGIMNALNKFSQENKCLCSLVSIIVFAKCIRPKIGLSIKACCYQSRPSTDIYTYSS